MTLDVRLSVLFQAVIVLLMLLVCDAFTWLALHFHLINFNMDVFWVISLSFTFVFVVCNCLIFVYAENMNTYWQHSILAYAVIAFISSILAGKLSGLSIDSAGSFRWIYIVFSIGYIIFLSMIRTMRWIVVLAKREDKRLRGED